ncbi:biopolymer transport ExbB like protein [Thermosynechococcus vestitus BP-1]|uniref:Biopolymer transport ExbB like protein n=1 Tax=Thermosynechococcus vestitus (strain NIES-2133 / IAM M-273 / BP-1) TaxID=197221 RepID=Q8DM10_THEVB|nr:biopolymer transport ExbB like protein [Thermosynechococcus vestitus BP-1]
MRLPLIGIKIHSCEVSLHERNHLFRQGSKDNGSRPLAVRFARIWETITATGWTILNLGCSNRESIVNIAEIFNRGGLAMWPLLILSILTLGTIFERLWFWGMVLRGETKLAEQILDAARHDWQEALELAANACDQPIGRFLYTPLQLIDTNPEIFRLALEAAADEELSAMRRGEKVLEATITMAPLLGLLGTVLGLISALSSIRLGDIGTPATLGVGLGISEALISTASGLVIAIIALAFQRLFQAFLLQQAQIFRRTGNELELTYRQAWLEQRIKGEAEKTLF